MTVLVTGGAASGKSELAERIAVSFGERRMYIATMMPSCEEDTEKILRHQNMRAGRGFTAIERYYSLETLRLPANTACALLECVSNLVANEMFSRKIPPGALERHILAGVCALRDQTRHLVIVTNEIFSDEKIYDEQMQDYLRALAACNSALAEAADTVIEAVCGIPVYLKGELIPEKPD